MSTDSSRSPALLSLPNQLTLFRFVLAAGLFALIDLQLWWACLAVFVLATFTDWLDGYLARRLGQTSRIGRVLDPLADKVLVCGAYVFLLPLGNEQGWLCAWIVTLVVGRELIITTIRGYVESQGIKFGADRLGKIKMVLQSAALVAIFITMGIQSYLSSEGRTAFGVTRDILIYAMLASTLISGIQYVWKASILLRQHGGDAT